MSDDNDNDVHPLLKLLLLIFILIASGIFLYEIGNSFGAYLTLPIWAFIIVVTGIFDIAVYIRITRPRGR